MSDTPTLDEILCCPTKCEAVACQLPPENCRAYAIGPATRSALTAAGYVVEQGWQPIETAPRDGTRVMLFRPGAPTIAVIVSGNYHSDKYAAKPRPYWTNDQERLWGLLATRAIQPTHWRPLPAGPTGAPA